MLVTHDKQHGINTPSKLLKGAEHQGTLKVRLNNGMQVSDPHSEHLIYWKLGALLGKSLHLFMHSKLHSKTLAYDRTQNSRGLHAKDESYLKCSAMAAIRSLQNDHSSFLY